MSELGQILGEFCKSRFNNYTQTGKKMQMLLFSQLITPSFFASIVEIVVQLDVNVIQLLPKNIVHTKKKKKILCMRRYDYKLPVKMTDTSSGQRKVPNFNVASYLDFCCVSDHQSY